VTVTLMDANPEKSGVIALPGHRIFPYPNWAGKGTIVAVIGTTKDDTIALLDVSDPPQAKLKKVLWRRTDGPDVAPSYPVYLAATGRCIFAGTPARHTGALFTITRDNPGPAKPLGRKGFGPWISDLAISPDGRYVLYSVHGPARAEGDRGNGGGGN
jgi:hypothetical protein